MSTTETTLAAFIEKHGLKIEFIPVRASQDKETEYKTWQLHYAATITTKDGSKEEEFDWIAGYGNAVETLRASMRKPWTTWNGNPMAEMICKGTDASKFTDQKRRVRVVMEWMLKNYKPDPASLLDGLKLDASSGEPSFEDFCSEFGYDTDSRTAEKTWRACQENGRKLRRLLGARAFAELLNETESL